MYVSVSVLFSIVVFVPHLSLVCCSSDVVVVCLVIMITSLIVNTWKALVCMFLSILSVDNCVAVVTNAAE